MLTQPGDGVMVQTPVYPPILHAPANSGCTRDEMELTRGADGSYYIDWERFEQAITPRTRAFILCNPHNPVGRVFRRDELERMAEICLRHNVTLVSDEIHCELLFSGQRHRPVASLAPEIEAHTITLIAPSKTFNIAGLDCSMGIVPDVNTRKLLNARAACAGGNVWVCRCCGHRDVSLLIKYALLESKRILWTISPLPAEVR